MAVLQELRERGMLVAFFCLSLPFYFLRLPSASLFSRSSACFSRSSACRFFRLLPSFFCPKVKVFVIWRAVDGH